MVLSYTSLILKTSPTHFQVLMEFLHHQRFMNYCLGKLRTCPWSELDGLQAETKIIDDHLGGINSKGFLTINSQPAVNGAKSDAPLVGSLTLKLLIRMQGRLIHKRTLKHDLSWQVKCSNLQNDHLDTSKIMYHISTRHDRDTLECLVAGLEQAGVQMCTLEVGVLTCQLKPSVWLRIMPFF